MTEISLNWRLVRLGGAPWTAGTDNGGRLTGGRGARVTKKRHQGREAPTIDVLALEAADNQNMTKAAVVVRVSFASVMTMAALT